ncbi:hypothetical protein FRX31_033724 [Thalictrum thalictroides]|uniref:Transmembrane protein n=1 Tax=Thalictrum thalictroides TaxID=46969 RepID=A0A7J6UWX6_THATH|nr:hypothetical protein FRX31_033724 [Thalictrum thalictroides]
MKTSSTRQEKHSNNLQKKYNDLEQDWNSFQNSNPPRQRCSTDDVNILPELHNDSPTNLIPALQQHKCSGEWKVWTNDLAILETIAERKAARESGKFKGRRLFISSETASSLGLSEKEIYNSEMSSWCSSSTNQDDIDDDDGQVYNVCTCSASRSVENKEALVIGDAKDKEQRVANASSSIGVIKGGKRMALMGSFVVVGVLMVFTVFIISFTSLDEEREFMFLT